MKNKVWTKTVIATEEQNVEIYPTETFDGIIIETKELVYERIKGEIELTGEIELLKYQDLNDYLNSKNKP